MFSKFTAALVALVLTTSLVVTAQPTDLNDGLDRIIFTGRGDPSSNDDDDDDGGDMGDDASFQANMVQYHNMYRSRHGVPPMTWDDSAAAAGQEWADKCVFKHTRHNPFGQNLAVTDGPKFTAKTVTGLWYDEIDMYDFNDQGFSKKTGHFTQMVWKNTTGVGCARVTSCTARELKFHRDGSGINVVCNYNPPGNYDGRYYENVFPPTN